MIDTSKQNPSPMLTGSGPQLKPPTSKIGQPHVLNSWKEIAAYMGRSVRTVQRLEVDLGLPVRRLHGHARSSVTAIASEIDEWLKSFVPKRNDGFGDASGRKMQLFDATTRVLLVEDTETTLYLMERQLRHLGYKVMTAQTGRIALELASSFADIVLLDLNLPEIHGLEVLRRLRTSLNTSHIPVICTSATYAPEGAAPVALQLGAKRFLAHPISPDALHGAIQDVLISREPYAAPAVSVGGESNSITS